MFRVLIKSAKTWLSRRKGFYRTLFRFRCLVYAACEVFSAAVTRLLGKEYLFGVEIISDSGKPPVFKHELAACLRFKNEALYLAEWIEYHRLIGVDHFYLYNNNSTDGFEAILEPYLAQGIVTLHHWPAVPASPSADLHCVRTYRREARWIAFIDADEFIFPVQDRSLRSILGDFAQAPALALNWLYFGSGGHVARPEGLVIENYTKRAGESNRHVKSIINPRKVIRYGNSHHWFYSGAKLAVNENGIPVYGSFSEPPSGRLIRINHYYSKSVEEFQAKAAMKSWVDRESARFPSRTLAKSAELDGMHNEVEDASAHRYAAQLNDLASGRAHTRNGSEA